MVGYGPQADAGLGSFHPFTNRSGLAGHARCRSSSGPIAEAKNGRVPQPIL